MYEQRSHDPSRRYPESPSPRIPESPDPPLNPSSSPPSHNSRYLPSSNRFLTRTNDVAGHFIPSASNRKQEMLAFIKKHLPSETANSKQAAPATNGLAVTKEELRQNGE